jgi:hypothetical protein
MNSIPPPPDLDIECSACRRRIIDGKWSCCCRVHYTCLLLLALWHLWRGRLSN